MKQPNGQSKQMWKTNHLKPYTDSIQLEMLLPIVEKNPKMGKVLKSPLFDFVFESSLQNLPRTSDTNQYIRIFETKLV